MKLIRNLGYSRRNNCLQTQKKGARQKREDLSTKCSRYENGAPKKKRKKDETKKGGGGKEGEE